MKFIALLVALYCLNVAITLGFDLVGLRLAAMAHIEIPADRRGFRNVLRRALLHPWEWLGGVRAVVRGMIEGFKEAWNGTRK